MPKLRTAKGVQFDANVTDFKRRTNEPDFTYVNLSTINHSVKEDDTENNRPFCEFREENNQPIIRDPSKHKLSLIKFTLDNVTRDLPATMFHTLPNSDEGIYSVTIRYTDENGEVFSATQNVEFSAQREGQKPVATTALGHQVFEVYTIDWMVMLFNTALENAFQNVVEQIPEGTSKGLPPSIHYDSNTNKFSIYFDKRDDWETDLDDDGLEKWNLYFNSNTYNVFQNFPVYFTNQPNIGQYAMVLVQNPRNINTVQLINVEDPSEDNLYYTVVTQEIGSLGNYWSPIQSIVVRSEGSLALVPTLQTKPQQYGEDSFSISDANNHSDNILTEFTIDKDNPLSWCENLTFVSTRYRWFSIGDTQTNQLHSLQLGFYYRDRFTNQLHSLRMPNQSSANIDLLFQKKDLED